MKALTSNGLTKYVFVVAVKLHLHQFIMFFVARFLAMGSQDYADVRARVAGIRFAQHTKNIREATGPAICNVCLRYIDHLALYRRNDCQNAYSRYLDGNCIIYRIIIKPYGF